MDSGQTNEAFFHVTLSPAGDGRNGRVELVLNITVSGSIGQQKHDPYPLRHAGRQIAAAQLRVKFSALGRIQRKCRGQRHDCSALFSN